MSTRFKVEKLGTKRFAVIDSRKKGDARVIDTFRTRTEADAEAEKCNADLAVEKVAAPALKEGEYVVKSIGDVLAQCPGETGEIGRARQIAEMSVADRLAAAKLEAAAKREWKLSGSKGEQPATPVLDWMTANPVATRKAQKQSGTTKRVSKKLEANKQIAGQRFERNGHTAVIESDGTWTVTRADGSQVAGLKSATAASCAAEQKPRSATGYWQPVTDEAVAAAA